MRVVQPHIRRPGRWSAPRVVLRTMPPPRLGAGPGREVRPLIRHGRRPRSRRPADGPRPFRAEASGPKLCRRSRTSSTPGRSTGEICQRSKKPWVSSRERFTAGTGEQADEGWQQPATSLSPPFDAPVEHARVGRRYPVLSERRTGYDRCTGGGVTHLLVRLAGRHVVHRFAMIMRKPPEMTEHVARVKQLVIALKRV